MAKTIENAGAGADAWDTACSAIFNLQAAGWVPVKVLDEADFDDLLANLPYGAKR